MHRVSGGVSIVSIQRDYYVVVPFEKFGYVKNAIIINRIDEIYENIYSKYINKFHPIGMACVLRAYAHTCAHESIGVLRVKEKSEEYKVRQLINECGPLVLPGFLGTGCWATSHL